MERIERVANVVCHLLDVHVIKCSIDEKGRGVDRETQSESSNNGQKLFVVWPHPPERNWTSHKALCAGCANCTEVNVRKDFFFVRVRISKSFIPKLRVNENA